MARPDLDLAEAKRLLINVRKWIQDNYVNGTLDPWAAGCIYSDILTAISSIELVKEELRDCPRNLK